MKTSMNLTLLQGDALYYDYEEKNVFDCLQIQNIFENSKTKQRKNRIHIEQKTLSAFLVDFSIFFSYFLYEKASSTLEFNGSLVVLQKIFKVAYKYVQYIGYSELRKLYCIHEPSPDFNICASKGSSCIRVATISQISREIRFEYEIFSN